MEERLKEFDRIWKIAFTQSLERWDVYYESKKLNKFWSLTETYRLTFYIKNIKNYSPSKEEDIWWSLACSFGTEWYSPLEALQRAIAFYVQVWIRAKQDVNGVLDEYVLTKKPINHETKTSINQD